MVITNYDSTSKPSEWVCNFLKQLNKVSSCPNFSQRKVLLKPKLFYVKYCCTLSRPWTPGEIIIYYPSPWGIFSASITVPMFIIVNLHNRTGEGKRVEVEGGEGGGGGVEGGRANLVWQDKPDNNIVWKNFTKNFTFLWSDLFVKDQKALRLSDDHDKTRD